MPVSVCRKQAPVYVCLCVQCGEVGMGGMGAGFLFEKKNQESQVKSIVSF